MTARTVSARDLETMAHAAHEHIELPGPEGGWATATINGHAYRALVSPVPKRRYASIPEGTATHEVEAVEES